MPRELVLTDVERRVALRQVGGRSIRIVRGHLRQDILGRLPLLELVVAVTDFEQGIRHLARLRVFVDDELERGERVGEILVHVIGFAEPVLGIARKRVGRILRQEVGEGRFRRAIIPLQQIAVGRLVGLLWVAACISGRRKRCRRDSISTA